jgi:DNA modification methylase
LEVNKVFEGDCLEVMRTLQNNCIDTIITDPPYGLEFLGKEWDHGIPGPAYWREALRVAKPGATLMAFGGTRTHHRLMVAIEDAGWEIRDVIMWIYGCLSEDTEILTSDGWKTYDTLFDGSMVACYNISDDTFDFMPIEDIVTYEYEDTAYHIQSDNTDQIVSKNHRCIVERGGKKVFRYAETLEPKESVPILESLQDLWKSFPNTQPYPSKQEQALQNMHLCNQGDKEEEIAIRAKDDAGQVSHLRQGILQERRLGEKVQESLLQSALQWDSTRQGMEKARSQRPGSVVRGDGGTIQAISDGTKQPRLEGGCNLPQKGWELWESVNKICEVSRKIQEYGTARRVCNGTSVNSSSSYQETPKEKGSGASYKPQCRGQQTRKLDVIQEQQRSQAVRASRYTRTDLATITPIHYKGIMWCVKVPSGAFVARRNGKIFVTGNSGFPKSLDIGKSLDKRAIVDCSECDGSGRFLPMGEDWVKELAETENIPYETAVIAYQEKCDNCDGTGKVKGAEREVVGYQKALGNAREKGAAGHYANGINNVTNNKEVVKDGWNITAPATPQALKWDGWGTALKPAYEIILCARKPLKTVPFYDIITEANILLGAMLCLLLSSVKDAETILRSSLTEPNEVNFIFAATIVGLLNTQRSEDLSEKMAMFNSPETVSTCLNIAILWNNLLGTVLNQGSKFTIKTEIEVTTALRTLNSLILPIIPEFIIKGESLAGGLQSNVSNAAKNTTSEKRNTKDIQSVFVAELATWQTDKSGTIANIAAKNLQLIIPSVYSVLKSVTPIPEEKNKITPAYEPIILAMKPNEGSYADNALKWGVAGLWMRGGRVEANDENLIRPVGNGSVNCYEWRNSPNPMHGRPTGGLKGRFPANVIHDGSEEVEAEFAKAGVSSSTNHQRNNQPSLSRSMSGPNTGHVSFDHNDSGSPARFFQQCPPDPTDHPDIARFHYCPKAPRSERSTPGNNHPTQKPLSLMRYLAKLTKTPTGGVILDPFAGSGTTGLAAIAEGRDYILIEKEPEYCEIINRRIAEYTGQEIEVKEIELTETESVKQLSLW